MMGCNGVKNTCILTYAGIFYGLTNWKYKNTST